MRKEKQKIVMSWSGGKDSALALYELMKSSEYEVLALLTTVTEDYDRISMHGVRRELLEDQARSIGLPLEIVYIPKNADNAIYESRMKRALDDFSASGVRAVAFGDIFLQDLRTYREEKLALCGMSALFPLWGIETRIIAQRFSETGFKAVVTCVDTKVLDASFSGSCVDRQFFDSLPSGIDPCGENGEFHSFVFEGPVFKESIPISIGHSVIRDSFCFCDVLPGQIPAGCIPEI